MKDVLIFGDSNTWGWNPEDGSRFPWPVRWPGVLQNELGKEYRIIEEGLSGRTTVWEDPIERNKCGAAQLVPILESHKPLDLIIFMLGTNDLKPRFSVTSEDVADSIGTLIALARTAACGNGAGNPAILVISPARVTGLADWKARFAGAEEKSARLAPLYAAIARDLNCAFLDAAELVAPSPIDGIHFSAEAHGILGRAVASKVRTLFKQDRT